MSDRYVIRSTTGYSAIGRAKPTTEWMVLDQLACYRLVYTTEPRYDPAVRAQAEEICEWLNAGGKPPPKASHDPRNRRTWA